jgi:hypothetical protein
MGRNFISENVTLVSVILFVIIFSAIQTYKPSFLYNSNGSIREFGIGYKNKTIFPLWLFSIVLGIFCYVFVLYYTVHHRLF